MIAPLFLTYSNFGSSVVPGAGPASGFLDECLRRPVVPDCIELVGGLFLGIGLDGWLLLLLVQARFAASGLTCGGKKYS